MILWYDIYLFVITNTRPSDWDKRRELILERDEYKCKNCGRDSSNLEVHHVVPLEKGGSNSIDNLITLCKDCHNSIHSNSKFAPARFGETSSETTSTSNDTSSSDNHPIGQDFLQKQRDDSQKRLEDCPECTHSVCRHKRYDGMTKFCQNCRTLWELKNDSWDIASCPHCDSCKGFTWGFEGGRLGSCNQCGVDFYPAKDTIQ